MSALMIDQARRCVCLEEQEIRLTPQAYRVLVCLAQRSGEVVSKEELMQAMWPRADHGNEWSGHGDPAAVDLVVFRLRQKLGVSAGDPAYLETRRGFGYILHNACLVEQTAKAAEEAKPEISSARVGPPAMAGVHELWAKLTRREWEIFLLLGDDKSTRLTSRALAQQIGIAEGTIKKHLQNIYRKLGVENRAGAALLAMQARILQRRDELG